MAKGRKTVSVEYVRERVNYLLKNADNGRDNVTPDQAFRMGAASVLESILHETGNYKGFGYHDLQHNPETDEYDIPDESRRRYY